MAKKYNNINEKGLKMIKDLQSITDLKSDKFLVDEGKKDALDDALIYFQRKIARCI